MKIVANTHHGYLVEATSDELARAAGYEDTREAPGWDRSRYTFSIGATINVAETLTYLGKLRKHEKECRDSAAVLRALATMLDSAMPTTFIPTTEPEPAK